MSANDILIVFMISCTICFVWGMYNNYRTYSQRVAMLNKMPSPQGATMHEISASILSYEEFRNVSYESHFRALMTFRDPKKIYPPSLQKYM